MASPHPSIIGSGDRVPAGSEHDLRTMLLDLAVLHGADRAELAGDSLAALLALRGQLEAAVAVRAELERTKLALAEARDAAKLPAALEAEIAQEALTAERGRILAIVDSWIEDDKRLRAKWKAASEEADADKAACADMVEAISTRIRCVGALRLDLAKEPA